MVEKVEFEWVRGRGLRALKAFELAPGPGCNWIVGENGVGKTTLLEAFYLVARGRSFRGRRVGPLVGWGERSAEVFANVRKGEKRFRRLWGSDSAGDGEGGQLLVRMIGDRAYELVEGGPPLRRRFVDWNIAQSAPGYLEKWRLFRRIASQRNAWLRSGGQGLRVWDKAYADVHEAIDAARSRWLDRLQLELEPLAARLLGLEGLRLRWRSSVGPGTSALESLQAAMAVDLRRGFTGSTPAKGDFALSWQGRAWMGSRGQNKAMVVLMQVAAARVLEDVAGVRSAWLVDDLASELSQSYSRRLLRLLVDEGCQIMVTSLERPSGGGSAQVDNVFHVEHGGRLRDG